MHRRLYRYHFSLSLKNALPLQPPPSCGGGGKRGSQSKHRGPQRGEGVKVISIEPPLGGDVKLHTTEHAWKPNMRARGNRKEPDETNTNVSWDFSYSHTKLFTWSMDFPILSVPSSVFIYFLFADCMLQLSFQSLK